MKALLLSAGLGTRFRPYTERLPKPAIPLLNLPLGRHPLLYFEKTVSRLVVNLHYMPGRVQQVFRNSPFASRTEFSFELEQPLGSGGAIWQAREKLRGDHSFWYINGDEVFMGLEDYHIEQMIESHRKSNALATIMVTPHPEAGKKLGAICVDQEGRVANIVRTAQTSDNPKHFVGIMLLHEDIFDMLPEGSSNIFYDTLVQQIAAGKKVNAYEVPLSWYEMGDLKNYLDATQELLNVMDSERFPYWQELLRNALPECRLEKNDHSIIWRHESAIQNAEIHGFAVLGRNCQVNAPITNTVVGNDVIVDQSVRDELLINSASS